MSEPYDYLFKYIVIGESGVGKSSIIRKYLYNKFTQQNQPTIGVDFGAQSLEIQPENSDSQLNIKLHIWDTAGQEVYNSLVRRYYTSSIGVIVVYDISSKHSFEKVNKWIQEAKQKGNQYMKFYLIGNKSDLLKREVTFSEAQYYADQNQLAGFSELSALSQGNTDIIQAFQILTQKITDDLLMNQDILKIINQGDRELGIKPWQYKKNDNQVDLNTTINKKQNFQKQICNC